MKRLALLIPIILLSSSCEIYEQDQNNINIEFFNELDTEVSNDLKLIAKKLNQANKNFSDRLFVNEILKQNFTELKKDSFLSMYDEMKSKSNDSEIVEVDSEVINEVNFILKEAKKEPSPDDFLDLLESKYNEISISNMVKRNKEILLTYIIIYKTSFVLLNENPNLVLYSDENQKIIWKCAFAVISGAIAGAGSGGAAGAVIGGAIGRLFGKKAEITGAGIGAIAGVIGGAIGGGLGAYAFACDEE